MVAAGVVATMADHDDIEQLSLSLGVGRICDTCGVSKPLEEYAWANRLEGRKQSKCRDCFRDYNRRRYEEKGEHIRAVVERYRHANAEAISDKRREAYWQDIERSRARGRESARKQNPKRREAKMEWARRDRAANPEKWREKSRRDYARNPQAHLQIQHRRRAAMVAAAAVRLTREMLEARLAFYGGLCWICRVAPAVEWDHVKPLKHGGAHMLCNLRPACVSCNRRKSSTWPFSA